jgi:protein TonB
MAGLDVAVIRLTAGAGRVGWPSRRRRLLAGTTGADAERWVGAWSAPALALSVLVHVAGVALLLPFRPPLFAAATEASFALVFEAAVQVAPETVSPQAEPHRSEPAEPPSSVSDPPEVEQSSAEFAAIAPPAAGLSSAAPSAVGLSSAAPSAAGLPSSPVPEATGPEWVAKRRPEAVASRPAAGNRGALVVRPPAARPVQGAQATAEAAPAPVIPPSPIAGMDTNRAPVYPASALRRREQGRVVLRVRVSAEGTPADIEFAVTSGNPHLDAAALAAVRQWRFMPARQAGRPVAGIAEVPIQFRLGT